MGSTWAVDASTAGFMVGVTTNGIACPRLVRPASIIGAQEGLIEIKVGRRPSRKVRRSKPMTVQAPMKTQSRFVVPSDLPPDLARGRGGMGLRNLKVMAPLCRPVEEAKAVLGAMAAHGLARGHDVTPQNLGRTLATAASAEAARASRPDSRSYRTEGGAARR
jgi:hypothetical protein